MTPSDTATLALRGFTRTTVMSWQRTVQSISGAVIVGLAFLLILGADLAGGEGADELQIQFNRGRAAFEAADMPGAIEAWTGVLQVLQQTRGTERDQASCHALIGAALHEMGKYNECIAEQYEALRLYRPIPGTQQQQAGCYQNIGVALGSMGRYEEEITRQLEALQLYRQIDGTESQQGDCYKNIGEDLRHLGKSDEATRKQYEALNLYKKVGGTESRQAGCYQNIGAALIDLSEYEDSIAKQREAMTLYQQIRGTERQQAGCHINMGLVFGAAGRHEENIAEQQVALKLLEPIHGTERDQAACHENIGEVLRKMGRCDEDIAQQQQALKLLRPIRGTDLDQAGCLMNMGVALKRVGKFEEAIAQEQEALRLFQQFKGTERYQAGCYLNIGEALWPMGRYNEDIAKQRQALDLFQQLHGTESNQATCYGNIGMGYLAEGRFAEAISAFETAHEHGRSWWTLRGLGLAYRGRARPGDHERAVGSLLAAAEQAVSLRMEVAAYEYRVSVFEEPSGVFADLTAMLADYGQKKVAIRDEEVLQWARFPDSATAMLEAAFHYADRSKGRGLEDALHEKTRMKPAQTDVKLQAENRELSQRLSKLTSLREQLPVADVERKKRLTEEMDALQQRRNTIEAELAKTDFGGHDSPKFRKPMEMVAELPEGTAVLQYSIGEKEDWLLILSREGISGYRLEAATPALPELLERQEANLGQLLEAWKSRKQMIGLEGLVRLARERAEDQGREAKQNLVDAALEAQILERLGDVVLPASALAELRQKKIHHLLVIPDGCLHSLPLAMLRIAPENGRQRQYLIEEYAISYVPAMTTLETIRRQKAERERNRKSPRGELLAFANPDFGQGAAAPRDDMVTRVRGIRGDYYKSSGLRLMALPETETEALRVASLFGPAKRYASATDGMPEGSVVMCVGKDASEEMAKSLLGGSHGSWRYVLFSTHGLVDMRDGMLSCLALSTPAPDSQEDGYLQAQEVMELQLDADVVMLSACQTGLGRMRSGEGLVGLSGSFFYAGAESVCASLWQVPSGPTSQLVPEFFRQLKEGKVDRAEALRAAQLSVLRAGSSPDGRSADYSSPFCWAAFVLMGEYR